MSELVVSSTAVATAVFALPLLAAAGVAIVACRLAWSLTDQSLDAESLIGTPAVVAGFKQSARQARERFQMNYLKVGQAMSGPGGTTRSPVLVKEAAEALARAEAMQEAFRKQPVLAVVAEANKGETVRLALDQLTQAQTAFQLGAFVDAAHWGRQAGCALKDAFEAAAVRLADAQRVIVAEKAREALHHLGYRVEEASRGQATAFRAVRAAEVLGVVVTDGGRLVVDAAGFQGMECRKAMEALFRRLREQGVSVQAEANFAHRRREGGPLLATAGGTAKGLLDGMVRLRSSRKQEYARRAGNDERRRRLAVGHLANRQRTGGGS